MPHLIGQVLLLPWQQVTQLSLRKPNDIGLASFPVRVRAAFTQYPPLKLRCDWPVSSAHRPGTSLPSLTGSTQVRMQCTGCVKLIYWTATGTRILVETITNTLREIWNRIIGHI